MLISPTNPADKASLVEYDNFKITTGSERFNLYEDLVKNKSVALVVNQTSRVNGQLLPDFLLEQGVSIKKIFTPEHGYRGKADAGASIDYRKKAEAIEWVSLYGNKKKPSRSDLDGIDIMVFDIQDVGARFYTYVSTLHNVMESCAEMGIEVLVLDRPNPNGHYVDGPVLEPNQKSFVGKHQVPIVHGMTIAEYATMINEEGWLANGLQADLHVVKCKGYDHKTYYKLPYKPSPNLPNMRSVYLYPSLCLFEGTFVSVGRGTNMQFQVYGHPMYKEGKCAFRPKSRIGASSPKHEDLICFGFSLVKEDLGSLREARKLDLSHLIEFYRTFPFDKEDFFNGYFEKLSGVEQLQQQIKSGWTEEQIRQTWQPDLENFKKIRKKYLLYSDFDEV